MAAKHPSKIPRNLKVYIDTNIFHLYLREPQGPRKACTHLLEKVEKGEADDDTKLRYVCKSRSLISLKSEKKQRERELEELTEKYNENKKQIEVLEQNIKNGTFKLPPGLKLTKTDFEFY